jgi:hypothetical protein
MIWFMKRSSLLIYVMYLLPSELNWNLKWHHSFFSCYLFSTGFCTGSLPLKRCTLFFPLEGIADEIVRNAYFWLIVGRFSLLVVYSIPTVTIMFSSFSCSWWSISCPGFTVSSHCTGEGKACHWHPSLDPTQSGSSLHWVRPWSISWFIV